MITARTSQIALGLLGLIVASGLSGFFLGHRYARQNFVARNNPETWNRHVTREFDRIVRPTPDQSARVQIHLDEAVRELQQIRKETIARSTNVIWRLAAEVERELTPEQRTAFEAMKPKSAEVGLEVLHLPPTKPETRTAPK